MPPLPVLSGQQTREVFERLGWRFSRQRGSHMILVKPGSQVNLVVPDHKELDRGTLRALIRNAGMTTAEFTDTMNKL